MSKKIKYILISFLLFFSSVLFIYSYFRYLQVASAAKTVIATEKYTPPPTPPQSTGEGKEKNHIGSFAGIPEKAGDEANSVLEKPKIEATETTDKNTENIKIEVNGKSYDAKVEKGSTVYDAMKKLSGDSKSGFVFHSKEHSSLGNYVDSINGVLGTPGKYWLYYVNGKKASTGVSKNKIKSGDVVTWRQESF